MATQQSYNQIIDYLRNFADIHFQVQYFDNGFLSKLNTAATSTNNFPLLFVVPQSHTNTLHLPQTYTVRVYSLDVLQKDGSNQTDVISDTIQILNDLVKWILGDDTQSDNIDLVNQSPVAIPYTNTTVEYCGGWFMDLQLTVRLVDGICDIPAQ